MSAEAHYYRVGLFVLGGIAAIAAAVLILGGGQFLEEKILFETYLDESVQGLEVGSPVKFRGVQLGSVSRIELVSEAYDVPVGDRAQYGTHVRVLMELTPRPGDDVTLAERRERLERQIADGLRVRLASQGITGVSYMEADYLDPERNPTMEVAWRPEAIYVPSAPSTLKAISTAAERIFQRLENTEIESVVHNLDNLLVSLDAKVDELDAKRIEREIVGLVSELRATNARVQRTVEASRFDFELAVENLRVAAENFRDVSETARSYPSYLILGSPPAESQVLR